jgi:hypothetical protein
MARRNAYIVIRLVPGGIKYLAQDGRVWTDAFDRDSSWQGTKPQADLEASRWEGASVDRIDQLAEMP